MLGFIIDRPRRRAIRNSEEIARLGRQRAKDPVPQPLRDEVLVYTATRRKLTTRDRSAVPESRDQKKTWGELVRSTTDSPRGGGALSRPLEEPP